MAGVGLAGPNCAPDGTLYWGEARPQEAGRQVVCRRATDDEVQSGQASERRGVDVTPADSNVRTRVHEYGGAANLLGPGGDGVIYSNFADQRLYWCKADGSVVELTPPAAYEEDMRYRFADAVLDMDRNRLICVREDHTNPKPSEVVNTVCAVALDGSGAMEVLAEGCDFFAAPRLSPDGAKLAYVCWNHPNMPWDATELRVAELDEAGQVTATESVCGAEGATSVLQPLWSPASGELHFIADSSGWWNLYKQADGGKVVSLYPLQAEFAGEAPGWGLGGQNYCFLPDGRVVAIYQDTKSGASRVVLMQETASQGGLFGLFGGDAAMQREEFGQECLPYSVAAPCASPDGQTLYFLGSDLDAPGGIYSWSIPAAEQEKGEAPAPAEMLACSMSEDMRIDPAIVSRLERIKFPTAGGQTAYGYYYPPANPSFAAPDGTKPPLLVKAHGGPTACARSSLSAGIQFWTSRGFAVLDVDYRGSTGYGRAYRQKLNGQWGVADIEDVCFGAEYLVKQGLADPKQLAIDGGSAGGFTTLGALTFKDVFTAGCSMYGISDLEALAGDTHKFESRYLDRLVGRYPEDSALYKARGPINHLDQLACPMLLLQGAEDKVVPPNQAEMMYDAVKEQGLPCAIKIYPNEQHGFRRSENIENALNSELTFFAKVFGFEISSEDSAVLRISNLDAEGSDSDSDNLRDLLLA